MGALARKSDPITSHQAAALYVASGAHATHKQIVYAFVSEYPGKTARELQKIIEECCATSDNDKAVLDYHTIMRRLNDVAIKRDPRICTVLPGKAVSTWYPKNFKDGEFQC